MWTSLALDADGDFATTRKALEFVGKYQREDGKIPHEIAQGANFVRLVHGLSLRLCFRRRHPALHHRHE